MGTRTILTVCATSTLLLLVVLAVAGAPWWAVAGLAMLAGVTYLGAVAAGPGRDAPRL